MKALFFILFSVSSLFASNFQDFEKYHHLFTKEEIAKKIEAYLIKDPKNEAFYRLNEETFAIGDLQNGDVDFTLQLAKEPKEKQQPLPLSLKGAKIAIDPGHFGGPFSELEERFVKIPKELVGAENDLHFDEGTLTFLTALELKRLLENEGAIVFLTKHSIGTGSMTKSFFAWLENNPAIWKKNDTLGTLFRLYNKADLKERAEKINQFGPDITIVIHYNAQDENERQRLITHANYNLIFVPGAFKKNELASPSERYEFLRLALTDDIEKSVALSRHLAHEFTDKLKVPLVSDEDKIVYTKSSCIKVEEGIYCRNLALTRMVHSPVCYGETLIQNNEHEAIKLDAKDSEIGNTPCSGRIKLVAEAYFEGIKKYFATIN